LSESFVNKIYKDVLIVVWIYLKLRW